MLEGYHPRNTTSNDTRPTVRLSNQIIIHRRHHANLLHDARVRFPHARRRPHLRRRSHSRSAAEIENTPWFADRIDPTWLPESAANRSAEARAFRVASVIMSGFSAFRPLNLYRDPPCPYPPTTTIPACTSSAVFSPAFAILSTSLDSPSPSAARCTAAPCCSRHTHSPACPSPGSAPPKSPAA